MVCLSQEPTQRDRDTTWTPLVPTLTNALISKEHLQFAPDCPEPYKAIAQGVVDLLAGQIAIMSANATAQILDLDRAGKVRILSINSQSRIRSAPGIPTSIEAGLPAMVAQTTFGIFAPAGTPRGVLQRIGAVTRQVKADAQFHNELLTLGFEPVLDVGPDKAADVFRDERERWAPILKTVSTRPQ
jgi:tripartite-type tricarboxylate transporter receptor subunit TctC